MATPLEIHKEDGTDNFNWIFVPSSVWCSLSLSFKMIDSITGEGAICFAHPNTVSTLKNGYKSWVPPSLSVGW